MNVKTIGIDLAKTFSRSMGLTSTETLFNKQLRRNKMAFLFCQHPTLFDRAWRPVHLLISANKLISMAIMSN